MQPVIGDDQMAGASDPTQAFVLDPDLGRLNRRPAGAIFALEDKGVGK